MYLIENNTGKFFQLPKIKIDFDNDNSLMRMYESRVSNRPFPSSCLPSLQSESKCAVFVMVISSTLHMNET